MLLFHELVFDCFMEGAVIRTQPLEWVPVLGGVETVRFMLEADHVAGSPVNIQVQAFQLADMTNVIGASAIFLFNTSLTVGQTTMLSASITPSGAESPASYGYHLQVTLGGTSPKAHIRIWATGRGRA